MATPEELQRLHNPDLGASVAPIINKAMAEIKTIQDRANAEIRAQLEAQFNAPMDSPALRSTTPGRLDGRRL